MKDKRQLQVRAHFKDDDFDSSENWAFAFELLIPNEISKCLSGQAEKEKNVSSRGRSNYQVASYE